MANVYIKQDGLSGLAQALNAGIQGYREGQQVGLRNLRDQQNFQFAENQDARLEEEQGWKRTKHGFEVQDRLRYNEARPNYGTAVLDPTDEGNALVLHDMGFTNDMANALGGLRKQRYLDEGVDRFGRGESRMGDVYFGAAQGNAPKGRFEVNAQGVRVNELTGDVDIGAERLYESKVKADNLYKPTAAMIEAQAMGLESGSPEYNAFLREARLKPSVQVNTGEAGTFNPAKLNATQAATYQYSDRVNTADQQLRELEKGIASMDPMAFTLSQAAVGSSFGNRFVSPEHQMFDQASRNLINAILRRESGAAIAPSEFESAQRQYLPVPGDSPEVLAMKRQNRESLIQTMYGSIGRPVDRTFDNSDLHASETTVLDDGEAVAGETREVQTVTTPEARESNQTAPMTVGQREQIVTGPDGKRYRRLFNDDGTPMLDPSSGEPLFEALD